MHHILTCFLLMLLLSSTARAQFSVNVETGAALYGYNDIEVPGNEGSRLSLQDGFETTGRFFYRVGLEYTINEKHSLSAQFTPLTLTSVKSLDQNILFEGSTFPAGQVLAVNYRFNTYRLTYRYLFPRSGNFQWGLGVTAMLRNIRVDLKTEDRNATNTSNGFAPLLNFRLEWFAREQLSFLLQGDALVAPQGRAEDVLLAVLFYPSRVVTLKAGYRLVEGGIDTDQLYNYGLIHHALIGFTVHF